MTPPTAPPAPAAPGAAAHRPGHLPAPLAAAAVLAVVAAPVGWLAGGGPAAAGAAAGVGLVAVLQALFTVVIARTVTVAPATLLSIGLMSYVAKVTVVAGVLTVLAAVGWPGVRAMAWGVAAAVFVWTAAHLTWMARSRGPRR